MNFPFDPRRGLIVVQVELFGPAGSGILQLALDTGATSTIVNVAMLVAVGYDPGLAAGRVQVKREAASSLRPAWKLGS